MYHELRKNQGVKLGTIARELQLIKHTFLLAEKSSPPRIHIGLISRFPEGKTSDSGFSNANSWSALPTPAGVSASSRVVRLRHGMRLSDVVSRRWRHVNFEQGTVVMERYETKSGARRTFPMVGELRQLLESIRPEKYVPNDLLFHQRGKLIKRFDKAWAMACFKAGPPVRYIDEESFDRSRYRSTL